jgi:5'(3')-deoxyribonucleotidase
MKDFTIGIDVDGVLADLVDKVLYYQNSIYKTNLKHSDITSYDMESIMGKDNIINIFELMESNHDVKTVNVIPGAKELIQDLRQLGRVVFVTAPCPLYRGWADDRLYWLKTNFEASPYDVMSIYDKTLFNGQVLIDDSSSNIDKWMATNRPAIRVVQPWNEGGKGLLANNFKEVLDWVAEMKYCYEFQGQT